MHRNFNPIIEESYLPFFEDVYIVGARGNVITCRQSKRRRFNNIFDEYGISLRISLMNAEACEKKKIGF
jgi:hypothetical protein